MTLQESADRHCSDALDRLRLPGSVLGIGPLFDKTLVVGRAFTVLYAPVGTPHGTVGDYIDDVPPGWVVVLDNAGRGDCTVWGDVLTSMAHERGVAGTVVGGVCRDVSRALRLEYPIFSVGRFMRTGKDRVEVVEIGGTICAREAQVKAGDLVVGDEDGVVIVPQAKEREAADMVRRISDAEDAILAEALLPGGTLRAARERNGYHHLQHATTATEQ